MTPFSQMRATVCRLLFTVNGLGFAIVSIAILLIDALVTYFIIQKVPYTEIDWSTYMQQIECYMNKKIMNYSLIEGDTGPVVYPGGHISAYSYLYILTDAGKNIRMGQYIFMFLYLFNLILVLRLYYKSERIPPFVLPFLFCFGYRIHSIFVLRMFNDPLAMMIFYVAANFFISHRWFLGCIFYSLAVSIKMNVLLFAPALFFILLVNGGLIITIFHLFICAIIQVYMGSPFLFYDPVSYIRRSFDLGRVFMFKWTVNWRFLPEHVFLDSRLHLTLLALHIIAVGIFGYYMWFRSHGGLRASLVELSHGIRTRTGVAETLFALFTSNFIGMMFSRSLHYQFYSWYYHQLPFLLFWNSRCKDGHISVAASIAKVFILLGIEVCWNVYPSTSLSSSSLHILHAIILLYLIFNRVERYKRKMKAL